MSNLGQKKRCWTYQTTLLQYIYTTNCGDHRRLNGVTTPLQNKQTANKQTRADVHKFPARWSRVCVYLGESSLFSFFQGEDPSTLQQRAEWQALGLTHGRHLSPGAHSAVDLVELKHTADSGQARGGGRKGADDIIIIISAAGITP